MLTAQQLCLHIRQLLVRLPFLFNRMQTYLLPFNLYRSLESSTYWRTNPPPQYANNGCIKLPPIQIPKFDSDPLALHDSINVFKTSVHENTSIPQTHRFTYLQSSVSGKAKVLIRGYCSCNPALYNVALPELESRIGSPQGIVTAYIHRLKNWAHVSSQNPHTLVSFFTILKKTRPNIHKPPINRRPSFVNSTHYF